MNQTRIEHPSVFISYAWGTNEYQQKVLAFATDLCRDGIDVQLDKWALKEGYDTYAYMERSVIDPNITNVLILLDEQYEKKAAERVGGVGTETQIISPEIYNKVTQEKFIPVVFERDSEGRIHKPPFLKGLLHFDLSLSETYNEEYQRLVRRLYGIETYKKPELGKAPAWLDASSTVNSKAITSFSFLQFSQLNGKVKKEDFSIHLQEIFGRLVNYNIDYSDEKESSNEMDMQISFYNELLQIRDEYLDLLRYTVYIEEAEKDIARVLETTAKNLEDHFSVIENIKKTALHEMWIYTIAIFYKRNNYKSLSYLFGKTYFSYRNQPTSFALFYENNSDFNLAVSKKDGKKYHAGVISYWMQHINLNACSANEFVFADLLCYNYALYGKDYITDGWYWFPLTYIYARYNTILNEFSAKMQSEENLQQAMILFGYSNTQEFKQHMQKVNDLIKSNRLKRYRYETAFEYAPIIFDYIDTEKMGVFK